MFHNYQKLILAYADFYRGDNILKNLDHNNKFNYNCSSLDDTNNELSIIDNPKGYFNNRFYLKESSRSSEPTCNIEDNTNMNDSFNSLEIIDIINITVVLLNFIFAKRYLSNYLKNSIVLDKLGLRAKDRAKLDECIWRLLFYGFSSSWLIYSCFIKRQSQHYLMSNHAFEKYTFDFDLDEYLICIIEIGFYMHAVYAIIFEDIWRKDSPLIMIHHIAAIFCFIGFYITKAHRVAFIAVVLRDTCDVILEIGKLNMSLKIQHGKVVKSLDQSLKFLMIMFSTVFVINQLYYYPIFCLYHGLNIVKVHRLQSPTMTGIITCALIFLILDLFWFMLITRLLFRMLYYSGPITDVREYDHKEEEELMKQHAMRIGTGTDTHKSDKYCDKKMTL